MRPYIVLSSYLQITPDIAYRHTDIQMTPTEAEAEKGGPLASWHHRHFRLGLSGIFYILSLEFLENQVDWVTAGDRYQRKEKPER